MINLFDGASRRPRIHFQLPLSSFRAFLMSIVKTYESSLKKKLHLNRRIILAIV